MHQVLLTISMAAVVLQGGYSLRVELNHPDGFYGVGEEAVCTATLLKDGQPAVGETFRCSVKQEGKVIETKVFHAAGEPVSVEGTMDRPGWLYFGFEMLDDGGRPREGPGFFKHHAKPSIVGEIGAMFDPDKIRASPARPADFEGYWADCRARLDGVALKADLTPSPVPEKYEDKVECFAIEVTCPGKHPVRGYLAVPKGARPKSLPAITRACNGATPGRTWPSSALPGRGRSPFVPHGTPCRPAMTANITSGSPRPGTSRGRGTTTATAGSGTISSTG